MAITTFDGFLASQKQYVSFTKTGGAAAVAGNWTSTFALAGTTSGTAAAGNSANGIVPTSATTGFLPFASFPNTGYLTQVDYQTSVACRLKMFDMLFQAGTYNYNNATVTLSSQPSYAGRLPGSSYVGTQLWLHVSTSFSAGTAWSVTVTYTNQSGTTGRSTTSATYAAAALVNARLAQLPLAAGDTGIQKIESVAVTNGGTAMTAGVFNLLVLRPLWSARCRLASDGDVHDIAKTTMPVIYPTSAIFLAAASDTSSTGVIDLEVVIASG